MTPFQAFILGVIQGLTEFLPISSSGHLVLSQRLFGLREPELFFDISVHLGTLIAVIIFFQKDIRSIIASLVTFIVSLFKKETRLSYVWEDLNLRLTLLIVIGSVPTAFIGLMFSKIADQLFSSIFIVGCALIVTGVLLWITCLIKTEGKDISGFSIRNALTIGVAQGIAIIPGVSRSGSTIAVGLLLGLNRETSARYSFLLSIPAIAGAELLLSLKGIHGNAVFDMVTIIGMLTAGIVGYLALTLLVYIVKKGQIHLFSPYCWTVGLITLIVG